jgi:hypothetical protein
MAPSRALLAQESAPIFLVGSRFSGVEELHRILDAGASLALARDAGFLVDLLPPRGGWPDLHAYWEWLAEHAVFQAERLTIDPVLTYPELVQSFLVQLRRRARKPIAGGVVRRGIPALERLWPDARYVHVVRDGRRVAGAVLEARHSSNLWCALDGWVEAEEGWNVLASELRADQWIEIRHEDLSAEPRASLARIGEFLCLESCDLLRDTAAAIEARAQLATASSRPLHVDEIRLAEMRIGSLLEARGYGLGASALAVTGDRLRALGSPSSFPRHSGPLVPA